MANYKLHGSHPGAVDPAALLGRFFPTVGLLGAEILWFYVLFEGDWLECPRPGDLPYRWGRIAWRIREARRHRWGWFLAGLVAAVGHLFLLGWTGGFF